MAKLKIFTEGNFGVGVPNNVFQTFREGGVHHNQMSALVLAQNKMSAQSLSGLNNLRLSRGDNHGNAVQAVLDSGLATDEGTVLVWKAAQHTQPIVRINRDGSHEVVGHFQYDRNFGLVVKPLVGPSNDINRLAALIREVDGNHDLGAAALAEALIEKGVTL